MELRPDITVAAAKLTSGFDVSRELRQLGALLRDGEIVHRLAAGVYGSGGGLLAVTNRRVLLLRDGRGGQASEGFPLELLTSVEWVAGPARGTIIVGDADNTAELTQVEPVEGASVVKLIRSLVPQDSYEDDGYEDDYDEYDELAEAGEDALLTHGAPAMSGAGRASGGRDSRGRDSGGRDPGDREPGSQASRSGRFAVTMKLRQPRDTPLGAPPRSDSERSDSVRSSSDRPGSGRSGGSGRSVSTRSGTGRPGSDRLLPEQKSASERSMPTRAVRRAAADGERSLSERSLSERSVSERSVSERSGSAPAERRSTRTSGSLPVGAVPVSALDGRTPGDLDRSASFPEQQGIEQTGGSRHGRGAGGSGGHSAVPGVRSIEGSGALGSQLVGEVPVHKLAEETGGQSAVSRIDDRPAPFEDERPARYADHHDDDRHGAGRFQDDRFQDDRFQDDRLRDDRFREDRFGDDRDAVPSRFDERRPTRTGDRRGSRFDDDLDDVPSRFDEHRPSRSEERRGGRSDDRRRTMYDEDSGEFRRTRTAVDSGPLGVSGSQRGRGDVRSRGLLDDDDFDTPRRSKWLWIGGVAAAVAALGAVGGVALLHHSDSPAAVNPAPAASDSLAGPVVRVTKVVDGDTIEVSGPVTGQVEVLGISAPRSDKGQCGATASTAFASRTLAGTNVTLVTDPSQPATDRSGRRLASLRTDNGFDYAVLAAGAGMARYYDSGTPVAQAQDIKNAQTEAEKADRGLWGSPCNGRLTVSESGSSTAKKASTSGEGSTSSSTKSTTEPASTSGTSTTR
ncbi:MAG TPA: thermonuclease family protein [Pseudonocardia sp.]|nr:thermonuclease family protein [Pseudonocardia sp.]